MQLELTAAPEAELLMLSCQQSMALLFGLLPIAVLCDQMLAFLLT